jgi:hypothetical protein
LTVAEYIAGLELFDDITDLAAIGAAADLRIVKLNQQRNGKDDDELIDAKEAARMLGVSTSFLYTGRGRRLIPAVKVGRRKMYRKSAIQKFIERGGKA